MIREETYRAGWRSTPSRRYSLRYMREQARRGNFRAVRLHLYGWRAEHPDCQHNAGKGHTERGALRAVGRLCLRAGR